MSVWCLSQDLQRFRVPSFGRAVCLGSRDSLVLMENNEGGCLQSPMRLWLCRSCSIGGTCQSTTPNGTILGRPSNPARSLQGAGPFPLRLAFLFPGSKTDINDTLGPCAKGNLEFAYLGLPFCTVLALEVREKWEMWEVAGRCWGWHPDSTARWL